MEKSLQTLMDGLIDYAGLFPPASLDMRTAVGNFAAYGRSPEAGWLGRFVLPAARLEEFSAAAASVHAATMDTGSRETRSSAAALKAESSGAVPKFGSSGAPSETESSGAERPWRLSVLIGGDLIADLARIDACNHAAAAQGPRGARIDALEMKAARPGEIAAAMEVIPSGITPYFEFSLKEDAAPFLAVLASTGGRAKMRTGGVTPDLIPDPVEVARFLAACARAKVPFKATAGLHHPVRSRRKLTYAPDSPEAVMHGFLNVFLAAALAAEGAKAEELAALLREERAGALEFGAGEAAWRDRRISRARLEAIRKEFAVGFGSCSFEEPREDLAEAKLL